MATQTLDALRRGGIYDHIGFGFHRYSTDRQWLVPHFEKMLYDQALLSRAYLEAYQAGGRHSFARIAEEIFAYVLRDMRSPTGGFFSAEDADSEGEEGKFYLWQTAEIRDVLGHDAQAVIELYNLTAEGNFQDEATGTRKSANIPHLDRSLSDEAGDEPAPFWDKARKLLFDRREERVHPFKDDKILVDWNGLMIASLALGGSVLDNSKYTEAAARAADFVLKTMRARDGRLLHRYRGGQAGLTAHLDDYAFMIEGLIELYQASWQTRFLEAAVELADLMLDLFWDEQGGGLFFTPDDGEKLLTRQKETFDGAVPSGNSAAMSGLMRLSRLTGKSEYEDKALAIGRAFSRRASERPSMHTYMLSALDFALGPSLEIVVVGHPEAEDTRRIRRELARHYFPNKVVLFKPAGETAPEITRLAPFTRYHTTIDGKATVYVCRDFACELPTTNIETMLDLMRAAATPAASD